MANEIEGFVYLRYSTPFLSKERWRKNKTEKSEGKEEASSMHRPIERLCNYLTTFEIMNDSSLFVFESFKQSGESSNILD